MSNSKHPQAGQDRSRIPIRVGHIERILSDYRKGLLVEIGGKTSAVLTDYNEQYVKPLVERVEWLEMPWHEKLRVHARARWEHWRGIEPEGESGTEEDKTPEEVSPGESVDLTPAREIAGDD